MIGLNELPCIDEQNQVMEMSGDALEIDSIIQ